MEHQDGSFKSALTERQGIGQPSVVNPAINTYTNHFNNRALLSLDVYVDGILAGNTTILSKAITLVESVLPAHQELAQQIIEKCLLYSGNSLRVGITGVPGAGKSTFIEALGTHLVRQGNKLAVLAIDPSSERSKGSILGDKTRMEELSGESNAFIRPSPSAGSLGGVARKTRETIVLCEAAGFNYIFIETVGVGQSETTVCGMVDFFLLLQLANTGDELQGIKRGIMEMADAIAINKAEGDNKPKAILAQAQFKNALHLFPPTESGWIPPVDICSAYTKEGIDAIWQTILEYEKYTKAKGYFMHKRQIQAQGILAETIDAQLKQHFYNQRGIQEKLEKAKLDVADSKVSPYTLAQSLLDEYFAKNY
ncbi:MAG: methylmalonyl Co-A mutase-associated GTPase MeaB [Bacteroidales bacterium]